MASRAKSAPKAKVIKDEDEELDIEVEVERAPKKGAAAAPVVAQKKKKRQPKEAAPEKKAAPAKKAKKELPAPASSGEEDDEEEAVPVAVAAAAPEKKKRGPVKISNKNMPKGDRLDTVATYKFTSTSKKPGKARAGEAAKRESRYLQTTNGRLLRPAQVRRLVKAACENARVVLEKEAAPQIARLRARGKSVPTNLTISSNTQPRNLSEGAVSLLVTLVDNDVSAIFDLANKFRIAAGGRETLFATDLEHSIEIIHNRH